MRKICGRNSLPAGSNRPKSFPGTGPPGRLWRYTKRSVGGYRQMRDFSTGVRARARLVYFWLAGARVRDRVGMADLIRHCLTPRCEQIAPRFAEPRGEDAEYIYYAIKGFDELFSYPKTSSYHSFAQVIAEGMLSHHWHHYEIPQTDVRDG